MVTEVSLEWTTDGIRHPSFQGLREYKNPKEIVRGAEGGSRTRTSLSDNGFKSGQSGPVFLFPDTIKLAVPNFLSDNTKCHLPETALDQGIHSVVVKLL